MTYLKVDNASSLRTITPVPPCFTEIMNGFIPFTPYDPEPFSTIKGRLEIGYYYAAGKNCNTQRSQLTKPIIILDGFDPGDERKIGKIYGEQLAYNNVNNFGDSLRRQGYDVIIVNFPKYQVGSTPHPTFPWINMPVYRDGGADYVERNALAVIQLIKDVNMELSLNGSTEKLVVVGPSMGGLISRYALAYMEKKAQQYPTNSSWNHNTRLWVSFDSPHNGATIPIGTQKMLKKVGDVKASAKESLDKKLGSFAAKQMLLMHYTSPVDKENSYRNIFKANLSNNGLAGSDGFPQNLRKVALINGQLQGIQKYAGATGDYMNIRIKKKLWIAFYFFFLPGAELKCYFAPANNNVGMVHKTQLYFLGFLGLQAGSTNAFAYDSNGSIDKAPGGYYNSSQIILDEFISNGITNAISIEGNVSYPNLCFIPSKSALAYKGTNANLYENLSGTNLICSGETPFDNYFVPNQDEDHVSISAASAAWLFSELNRSPQYTMPLPPTVLPSPIQLVADGASCAGSVITCEAVVANNATTNNNIIWKVQTANGSYLSFTELSVPASINGVTTAFVPNTNNKKITITGAVGGLFGTINVSAQLDRTGCVTYAETNKSVYITSDPIVITGFSGGNCYDTDPNLTLWTNVSFFTNLDYEWEISGIQVFTYGINFIKAAQYLFAPQKPQTFLVRMRVKDPCGASGWSAWVSQWVTTNSCATDSKINNNKKASTTEISAEYPIAEKISVSPNPSSNQITIDNVLSGSTVKIYDSFGRLMLTSITVEGNSINIDISSIKTGIYVLEAILPNNMKVRKQIMKE